MMKVLCIGNREWMIGASETGKIGKQISFNFRILRKIEIVPKKSLRSIKTKSTNIQKLKKLC
jgi:hypothetical protein